MRKLIDHGRDDETGASAVEYGLLVAAIAAVIVVVVFAVGAATNGLWEQAEDALPDPPAVGEDVNGPGGINPP